MRRANDVRQLEKWLIHSKLTVSDGFDPPRVDAGGESRVGAQMREERHTIHCCARPPQRCALASSHDLITDLIRQGLQPGRQDRVP
jgi:hypothetical protein